MSDKSVAEKARVKPSTRIALVDPVPGIVDSLGLVDPLFVELSEAQLAFLFATSRERLAEQLSATVVALAPGAVVWVFFRKGSKAAGLDLNRDDVWAAAETLGMRPLGLVGVDADWSVFRLRPQG